MYSVCDDVVHVSVAVLSNRASPAAVVLVPMVTWPWTSTLVVLSQTICALSCQPAVVAATVIVPEVASTTLVPSSSSDRVSFGVALVEV